MTFHDLIECYAFTFRARNHSFKTLLIVLIASIQGQLSKKQFNELMMWLENENPHVLVSTVLTHWSLNQL